MTKKYRKHQKLPIKETEWMYEYIMKKYMKKEYLTIYLEQSMVDNSYKLLYSYNSLQNLDDKTFYINQWCEEHLTKKNYDKLQLTIRAKRKRHFDKIRLSDNKKNITIDYSSWKSLKGFSDQKDLSFSRALDMLVEFYYDKNPSEEPSTEIEIYNNDDSSNN